MSFNNSTNVTCSERTSNNDNMVDIYFAISWWFEYFLQTGIGIAGLIANTLAIPILLSVSQIYFIFSFVPQLIILKEDC